MFNIFNFGESRETIGILGLGYVGYPLALQCAKKHRRVLGFDINKKIIESVNNKSNHLGDHALDPDIRRTTVHATDDFSRIADCSTVIVCVPTPVDQKKQPDLRYVVSAAETISKYMSPETFIIIESTIYPGTCEEVIQPILDRAEKKYYLAHCPERINPGDRKWNVSNINRVVGGVDEESGKRAKRFYEGIIKGEVTLLKSIKAAEAVKIMENTFRDVNIAFVNEMAISLGLLGIDITEVIKGASTKPFGFLPHYPGCGVGGHCIAVDPYYLIERAKKNGFDHKFLSLAREINNHMPHYAVSLLEKNLAKRNETIKGTIIGVLGLSYKKNVKDDRESPSYAIIEELTKKGAIVIRYDPHFPDKSDVPSLDLFTKSSKYIILACDHDEFLSLTSDDLMRNGVEILIDGKNAFDKKSFENKITYAGIGA